MTTDIFALSDIATEAQHAFQAKHSQIDPVIGLSRALRKSGFPADIMTIDCFVSQKRITLILHDDKPNEIGYQLGFRDKDPHPSFTYVALESATSAWFEQMMESYLVGPAAV